MTKRYYYDCPIDATYMKENFHVKFDNVEYDGELIAESCYNLFSVGFFYLVEKIGSTLSISKNYKLKKIYVSPESEHIFKPQNTDRNEYGYVYNNGIWDLELPFSCQTEEWKGGETHTAFRSNKPFFMPMVDVINEWYKNSPNI